MTEDRKFALEEGEAFQACQDMLDRAAGDITELLNRWNGGELVFLLAAFQLTVDAFLPQLSKPDRVLFRTLGINTTTTRWSIETEEEIDE